LKQINFITGGPGHLPPLPPPLIGPCLRPNSGLSQKQNEFVDVFTMVHQTSNCHIQAVMKNLKFIILDYLAAKKSGILD